MSACYYICTILMLSIENIRLGTDYILHSYNTHTDTHRHTHTQTHTHTHTYTHTHTHTHILTGGNGDTKQ